ncbi:MAG: DUF488 domain-containing protein [Bacteroidota bacterium]
MPSERPPIYTIGYGSRPIEAFLNVLERYSIRYLLDVRSSPSSRFNKDYNKGDLQHHLYYSGIKYGFFGDLMGGRPDDPSCYYPNGQVDYDACRRSAPFLHGMSRLRKAYEGGHPVVLMCSEGRPEDCHRSKMIGVALDKAGIPVRHIDTAGRLRTQNEIIEIVTGGQSDMFKDSPTTGLASRGQYRPSRS